VIESDSEKIVIPSPSPSPARNLASLWSSGAGRLPSGTVPKSTENSQIPNDQHFLPPPRTTHPATPAHQPLHGAQNKQNPTIPKPTANHRLTPPPKHPGARDTGHGHLDRSRTSTSARRPPTTRGLAWPGRRARAMPRSPTPDPRPPHKPPPHRQPPTKPTGALGDVIALQKRHASSTRAMSVTPP
jgi:hypothetical protein